MKTSSFHRLLLAAALLLPPLTIRAATPPAPAVDFDRFDLNHDGKLDEKEFAALKAEAANSFGFTATKTEATERTGDLEVAKFLVDGQLPVEKIGPLLLATRTVKVYQFDANLDGNFDLADNPLQQRYSDHQLKDGALSAMIQTFRERLDQKPDRSQKSVEEVLTDLDVIEKESAANPLGKIRIRADTDVTLDGIGNLEKAKPATVSFTHDYKDRGREATNIQLALIAPIPANTVEVQSGDPLATQMFYLPSVMWQKINGTEKDDVDLITAGLGMGFSWRAKKPFPSRHQIAVTASYLSDREQSSELWKAEVAYTPTCSHWAIGAFKPIGELPLDGRLDLTFKASMVDVRDAGTNTKLADLDDTFRLGGTASLTVRPRGALWDRVTFVASYTYYSGLSGSPQKADLLDLGIQYQLDAAAHFSTEINYQDGEVTVVETPTQRLLLKFGVKF